MPKVNQEGHQINRKRVQRLMKMMRIEAIYPKPKLSRRNEEHKILLRSRAGITWIFYFDLFF